jgi:glycosyltransferase involved in cell wall biosynthesis
MEARLPKAVFAAIRPAPTLAARWRHGRAVQPSITETFGNVTLEAMACARPVVAEATGASLVDDA